MARNETSARSHLTDTRSQTSKDSEVPTSNVNYPLPSQQEPSRSKMMMNINEDSYLPQEPVLLTDYEEHRLSEQVREQLGSTSIVDRLKLFYQELTAYDPQSTNTVHYSTIQMLAQQLGVRVPVDDFISSLNNSLFQSLI